MINKIIKRNVTKKLIQYLNNGMNELINGNIWL